MEVNEILCLISSPKTFLNIVMKILSLITNVNKAKTGPAWKLTGNLELSHHEFWTTRKSNALGNNHYIISHSRMMLDTKTSVRYSDLCMCIFGLGM